MTLEAVKSLFNFGPSEMRGKSPSGKLGGGRDVEQLETAPPSHTDPGQIICAEISCLRSGMTSIIIPLGILIGGIYLLSAFPVGSGGYIAGVVLTSYGAVNIALALCCTSCCMSCIPFNSDQ